MPLESIEALVARLVIAEKEIDTLRLSDIEGRLWRAARDAQLRLMLGATVLGSGVISYIIATAEAV